MNYSLKKTTLFKYLAWPGIFCRKTKKREIPEFWKEYFRKGYGTVACGQFGICHGNNPDGTFRYVIGNRCEIEHCPDGGRVFHICYCQERTEIPEVFSLFSIPAHTWLKVECPVPLPGSIQRMYSVIEKEFPPGFIRCSAIDVEEYGKCEEPEDSQKENYMCWIWIPVLSSQSMRKSDKDI